jgi:pyruvate dehydrogenase E2 component (dihydrolipoamide acetyltransferase)
MPFIVNMPKLSPTMEEGTIAKWHVKEGDFVEAGAVLLEIATDKATMEYNALDEGYLRKILAPENTVISVNEPIAVFTVDKEESIEEFPPPPKKEAPKIEESKEKVVIEKSSKVQEGMIQPLFEPEPPLQDYVFQARKTGDQEIKASPLAKKLAKAKGIELSSLTGSGPSGRILSRDIDAGHPDLPVTFNRKEIPKEKPGSYEEIPLSPMRKIVGKRLQESKSFIPHFYVQQTVDASLLFSLRQELKDNGLKVTFNDFVIRAVSLALREHPSINTGFHSKNQTIIQFKTIDISVAVTIEGGLITPIIRHADYKDLGQISSEVKMLALKAKQQKLEPHEYKGGSFTISNLGMFGVSGFVAVINPPQAAILAVGGIEDAPIIKEGNITAGKIMKMALSVDHRVIDGAEAAKFIKTVQKYLQSPSLLLIH